MIVSAIVMMQHIWLDADPVSSSASSASQTH